MIVSSVLVAWIIFFTGNPAKNDPSTVTADFGATPVIDGSIEEGEWADANRVELGGAKTIWLKHDHKNLYIALNGDGGNLYFLKDDRIFVLHASWSLGWAEYSKIDQQSWRREREFEWELYRIQEKPEEEIREAISGYLQKHGWVASIVPLGKPQQSEFAISMKWLNIDLDDSLTARLETPRLLISSFQNLHPDERKRRGVTVEDLRLRWPPAAATNDSLGRGYAPAVIEMDVSRFGAVLIDPSGKQ